MTVISENEYLVRPGFVYVVLQQEQSDFLKIGMTYQSMSQRLDSLDSTSSPVPPTALWYEYVTDPKAVESEAHRLLAEHRVRLGREWFRLAPAVAIKVVAAVAGPYKISSSPVVTKVDMTEKLKEAFGNLLRLDLQQASVLHTVSGVILESVCRSSYGDAFITHHVLSLAEEDRQSGADFLDGGSAASHVEKLVNLDKKSFAVFFTHLVDDVEAEHLWEKSQNGHSPQA
ncbi:hypothetical protein StoSoilB3_43280 (plasmid) [Arthrobacter sp. StoSoilB3]|nr:hypothetical protein StoSoilB3_43280 [Arthrobacter sp. StoSoilB3]